MVGGVPGKFDELLTALSPRGILFIDEIHTIDPTSGGEARLLYERILDVAENRRSDLTIIGAGYSKKVQVRM